ncbi:hypothetical protein [Oceanobacillus bengalensis]|uniref:Uncharacterized protein n=1 Tax=Oceanobacillus bengalensis TaxID=1435466 RepID=A0A494Z330_9BACI|nr:hypothetical protein [Oceanobacillus bengalensis]RKQ16842.1 hypothetical protein D8M05_06200 [Oceanobacillus bengalensis]
MKLFNVSELPVCINDTDLKGKLYVSFQIGAGFASRRIIVDGSETIIGSATAKVYFNYLKIILKKKYHLDVDCRVTMNQSSIYWESTPEKCVGELQNVVNELFLASIEESIFVKEKEDTIERYKNNYKHLEFRGRMQILEFADKNKNFRLSQLSTDLLHVDLGKVSFMREHLFFPGNMFVFIHGNENQKQLETVSIPDKKTAEVEQVHHLQDFNFLQDEVLQRQMNGSYQCGGIKFDRNPTTVDLTLEHAVLSIIGEILFQGLHEVKVDRMDASILYYETPLKKYKLRVFDCITEVNIEKAKEEIMNKMDVLVGRKPKEFVLLAGKLYFNNIDIYLWFAYIKSINRKQMEDFLNMRDYKVREGYVNYYKEGDKYGVI